MKNRSSDKAMKVDTFKINNYFRQDYDRQTFYDEKHFYLHIDTIVLFDEDHLFGNIR
jgi:hypothetical protein